MKRILCAVLALVMIAGFAGCSRETTETEPIMASSEEFTEETVEETEEETEEPTEEETEETEETEEPTETTEETVPPCENHSWGYWVQLEAPTSSAEGKRVRTCVVCGTEDVQMIEKLPKPSSHKHKYKAETSKVTCDEDGIVYYHCDCGDWYQVEEKATDHTWGDWVIRPAPTKTTPGKKTRTCKKCKVKETETVYYCKDGEHNWGDWTISQGATETTPGKKTRTCKICGGVDTQSVQLCTNGHNYGSEKHQRANAAKQEDECYFKRCKTCGYKHVTKTIHKWGDWSPSKAATCTEEGLEERKCKICGEEDTPKTIPALGHTYGEDGLCTRCGAAKPAEGGGSQETQDPSNEDTDNEET